MDLLASDAAGNKTLSKDAGAARFVCTPCLMCSAPPSHHLSILLTTSKAAERGFNPVFSGLGRIGLGEIWDRERRLSYVLTFPAAHEQEQKTLEDVPKLWTLGTLHGRPAQPLRVLIVPITGSGLLTFLVSAPVSV